MKCEFSLARGDLGGWKTEAGRQAVETGKPGTGSWKEPSSLWPFCPFCSFSLARALGATAAAYFDRALQRPARVFQIIRASLGAVSSFSIVWVSSK
jgi:hypothetical protein